MMSNIHTLKTQCDQQSTEFTFQLEHTRERNATERQELCEKYENIIAQIRGELQALQSEYLDEKQLMRVAMEGKEAEHSTHMIDLESKLCEKILNESNKLTDLQAQMDAMKENYEKCLRKSSECLQDTTDTLTRRFKQQLDEREIQIKNLMDEIQTKKEEFFHYCKQLNVDNERRIAQLSLKHEMSLKDANDMLGKWRTDACILTKKHDTTANQSEQLKKDLALVTEQYNRSQKLVCQMEQNIIELQREIDARNKIVDNKELCLAQAFDKIAAMETMKQHLNGRAVELEAQIEPLNEQIKEYKHEIGQLKEAHAKLLVKIDDLNVEIKGLNDKRKIVSNALQIENDQVHYLQTRLHRLHGEIFEMIQFVQDPVRLKEMALGLHQKYSFVDYFIFRCFFVVENCDIQSYNLFRYAKDGDQPDMMNDSTKTIGILETKSALDRRKQWTKVKNSSNEAKITAMKQDRFEQNRLIKENLFLLAEIDRLKAALNSKSCKSKC